MEIINKKLVELKPYENNPRNNDEAVEVVANSIKEFGFKNPIIIDKDNVIVCGHTRYKAAEKLGFEDVPCIMADDLTEEQIKAFRLADNKTAELASWDFDLLDTELDSILDIDMADFGFEIEDKIPEVINNEDDIPEIDETESVVKIGELWRLGNHLLLCGDSTKKESFDVLFGEKRADMIFIDPPYNVNYSDGHKNERKILNDNFKTDEECGEKLWLPAFENLREFSNEKCSYYCCMPQGGTHMVVMMMMMMKAGWAVKHELIWKKQSIVLNRADYNYQHEPILYGWNKKHEFYGKGKFATTSVWEIDRPTKSKEHPTMKPIELVEEALEDSSVAGDIVADVFSGSGTTLIACERLNRICYAMELDPKYCDVIIKRWENLTGEKAIKVKGDENGTT